ncbi:hypothetical protein [Bradyrhizobium tunisiense]|uniref:hypothetical protein n=1 Tax=Bradyrhizobium tunisiense TaxID=3278709 RepID=UPI0035E0491B
MLFGCGYAIRKAELFDLMNVSRDANNLASELQNRWQHRAIIVIRWANACAGVCLDRDAAVDRHHMRAVGSGAQGPTRCLRVRHDFFGTTEFP